MLDIGAIGQYVRLRVVWLFNAIWPIVVCNIYLIYNHVDLLYPVRDNDIEVGFSPGNIPFLLTSVKFDLIGHALLLDFIALGGIISMVVILITVPPILKDSSRYNPLADGCILFILIISFVGKSRGMM
jgi:hypothetical protein